MTKARRARVINTASRTSRPIELEMKTYSSQSITDPWASFYGDGATELMAVKPTYNPLSLRRLPDENAMLRQCIDAFVTNIESFGHRLEFVGEEGTEGTPEAQAEKQRIKNLLDNPNGEYSLIELRQRLRRDLETYGYATLEVGRDNTGQITLLYHIPAHTMRMTAKDSEVVRVRRRMVRNGRLATVPVNCRFRRFIQRVGTKTIYFKEFGDPRSIDPKSGKERQLPIEEQATEIVHLSVWASGDPYGMPRWINQLPAVLGTREAELTNLQFFKDNAIPAMAVLVSGGMLTDDSVENIERMFVNHAGRESMNRVLVIEAEGDEEGASEAGQIPAPKLDLKPLNGDRQNDALFEKYEEAGYKKIRSSFRLPPIFVGLSEDLTYATAQASLSTAETQVFNPERNKIDDLFNFQLLLNQNGEPPKYWAFRSLPPRVTNPQDVLTAISRFNQVGAMTPNIAIGLANELFDLDIKMIEETWGDYPWPMVQDLIQQNKLAIDGLENMEPPTPPKEEADVPPPDPDQTIDEAEVERIVREVVQRVARLRSRRRVAV